MKTVDIQKSIAEKVRELRLARGWTQARLAGLLGISQNRLSEIERDKGSFSAEQLILLLSRFNVPLSYFLPASFSASSQTEGGAGVPRRFFSALPYSPPLDHFQNALARQGAWHLRETADLLPSERLDQANDLIREVLVLAESSRQIAALAPVFVTHARHLNLDKLALDLDRFKLLPRLCWFLDSLFDAVDNLTLGDPSMPWGEKYADTRGLLLNHRLRRTPAGARLSDEILERDLLGVSEKTLQEVRKTRSRWARKWSLLTRIQTEDFIRALQEASHGR